jgi:hypothetical protein
MHSDNGHSIPVSITSLKLHASWREETRLLHFNVAAPAQTALHSFTIPSHPTFPLMGSQQEYFALKLLRLHSRELIKMP